jgi:hypothetical protein
MFSSTGSFLQDYPEFHWQSFPLIGPSFSFHVVACIASTYEIVKVRFRLELQGEALVGGGRRARSFRDPIGKPTSTHPERGGKTPRQASSPSLAIASKA